MSPAKRGPAPCVELVFFEAQGRADFGQTMTGSGFALYRRESRIFDSLVADLPPTPRLWQPGVFGQVRDV
jgi:hypothetical protein